MLECYIVGGICFGNEPTGAGFYTLSYDAEASYNAPCTPNTGRAIPYLEEFALIAGQFCPFYFYWGWEGSTPFARISLLIRTILSIVDLISAYMYVGNR